MSGLVLVDVVVRWKTVIAAAHCGALDDLDRKLIALSNDEALPTQTYTLSKRQIVDWRLGRTIRFRCCAGRPRTVAGGTAGTHARPRISAGRRGSSPNIVGIAFKQNRKAGGQGCCRMYMERLEDRSATGRTSMHDALAEAELQGLIHQKISRPPGQKSERTIVTCVDPEWR